VFNALIDTCVWLDLAQDRKLTPLLAAIEALVQQRPSCGFSSQSLCLTSSGGTAPGWRSLVPAA